MKRLPPMVKGFDGGHVKWQNLDDIDFSLLGFVLSCHLIIEHYLDEMIGTYAAGLNWDSARLTFAQKLALLPDAALPESHSPRAAIKDLNGLRNRLSHNIRFRPTDIDLQPFADFLTKVYKDPKDVPSDPVAVLEQFTSTVCSWFGGWIAGDAGTNKRKR